MRLSRENSADYCPSIRRDTASIVARESQSRTAGTGDTGPTLERIVTGQRTALGGARRRGVVVQSGIWSRVNGMVPIGTSRRMVDDIHGRRKNHPRREAALVATGSASIRRSRRHSIRPRVKCVVVVVDTAMHCTPFC